MRKNALLALGSAPAVLSDEDLLPLLHDPDDEVQNLCELALRSRGLQENHILLARYISDARPAARLRVVELLRETHDLEPGVWLRRLCQDPAPAVRAAAIRAAVSQSQVDMRACLTDMAEEDPSLTVRQLAAHYLQHSSSGSAQRTLKATRAAPGQEAWPTSARAVGRFLTGRGLPECRAKRAFDQRQVELIFSTIGGEQRAQVRGIMFAGKKRTEPSAKPALKPAAPGRIKPANGFMGSTL